MFVVETFIEESSPFTIVEYTVGAVPPAPTVNVYDVPAENLYPE
jgi:hypothetical protein